MKSKPWSARENETCRITNMVLSRSFRIWRRARTGTVHTGFRKIIDNRFLREFPATAGERIPEEYLGASLQESSFSQ